MALTAATAADTGTARREFAASIATYSDLITRVYRLGTDRASGQMHDAAVFGCAIGEKMVDEMWTTSVLHHSIAPSTAA
jgi:hypothetical protein